VLEDARGLLDVGASVLRLRREHRVELALPDDDVHLPADAGIGQQLLDVEQTAVAAVDLVLARAVAEHPPGDRHLGVLDGQGAVGLSIVSVTSARPSGARPDVPAKMTSSIVPPRRALAPCSPSTQLMASTTLDFPDPFGPTTQVMPGSRRSVVAEAKDLKPFSVRLLRCTGRLRRRSR
jgi:hypothetical protein